MAKKNKAYWKARALFFEQQFHAVQERNQLLIDRNKLLSAKESELRKEFDAKRAFMDKVEDAYSEYKIAFATGDFSTDESEGDWHAQSGGNDE